MTKIHISVFTYILILTIFLIGCDGDPGVRSVTHDDSISEFIQAFEGRGDLTDDSKPTPAYQAVTQFIHPDDLEIELVLAEPDIFQPVEISFDHRGRLWVVQYNQYPYPEGLNVTDIDNHLRVQFDKVPDAPPTGARGADKITFFEDTDGDGKFEKSTDAITGLNITTSVILGRGKIWVLNPPYLLAYPDRDDDGIPDEDPEIHLKGFGLEDTHAVANSLTWGSDGWLYGAQGSTTTANITSKVSENISFEGQAIWRYHPDTGIFEVFAEGGGNTFDVEIDAKGRLYSGDNGNDRGQYYKQGAYFVKNWGKHGPHSNPYTFGYLPNMELEGDRKRFTHAWIKYEDNSLPERYHGKMVAINPLQSYLQLTRLETNGSTFRNIDEERILETPDHWFRPVDIKSGPDGAIYISDWYDSRLSHVDPKDTWHKKSGRIYRLKSKGTPNSRFDLDLNKVSEDELINALSSQSKWFRQQAQRQFADRKDPQLTAKLLPLLDSENEQTVLEGLWALNLSGAFDGSVSLIALNHDDPYVRMWAVRLIGDSHQVTSNQALVLIRMSDSELHTEVRSQLAATAKRIDAKTALAMVKGGLLQNEVDALDPDIPLQIWWAMESKIATNQDEVINIYKDIALWKSGISQSTILFRLAQRLIMTRVPKDFAAATQLLGYAPSSQLAKPLTDGIFEGLRGRDIASLPSDLLEALKLFAVDIDEGPLAFGLRSGDSTSVVRALEKLDDTKADLYHRLNYAKIIGETTHPDALPVFLRIVENQQSPVSLRKAALAALQSYSEEEVGERVAMAYPDKLRADPDVRLAALSLLTSRASWALKLLNIIDKTKQVSKDDIPPYLVMQLSFLNDPLITERTRNMWEELIPTSVAQKEESFRRTLDIVLSGKGDRVNGRKIFETLCSSCHQLGPLGNALGPDLSTYDRSNTRDLLYNIVFPNADIREGYVNHLIRTKDGKMIIGTIISQHGDLLQLRSSSGESITMPQVNILEMKTLDRSLMPEGLISGLTNQELKDLFSFIEGEP
ncbi:MAG: c-type cytochrome [Bacteroidetes bacterium]|nr:c-type cytochrome [Bacteroidota bacterium]MDA1120506.1 c-type cytochrome [Bacteroidota bacterium]